MKNIFILIALISLFSFSACSQKNPPSNVKKEFTQKFAAAKSVKWDSEKENEWESEFKLNGKEMSACFDSAGNWLETEVEVSAKELPAAVANTLKNEYSGFKTKESSTIENPGMKGYEFALKNKKTEISVIIGTDGTVLKKESTDENKDEAFNEKDEKNENESDEAGEEKEMKTSGKIITINVIIGADGTVLKRESADENKEEAVNEKDEKNENKSASTGEEKEMKTPEKIVTINVIIGSDGTVLTRESAGKNKEESVNGKEEGKKEKEK
jgi:hypothetical protein